MSELKLLYNVGEIQLTEVTIGSVKFYAVYDEVSGISIDHGDTICVDIIEIAISIWRRAIIQKALFIMNDSPEESKHLLLEVQKYC